MALHVRFKFGTFLFRPLQNNNVKQSNSRFCEIGELTTVNFSFFLNLNATPTNLIPGLK